MFYSLLLLVAPSWTWERITKSNKGYFFILVTHLFPLFAAAAFVQGWSLQKYGRWQPHFHLTKTYTHLGVIHFESAQMVLWLLMIFVSALLVWLATENFHGRVPYLRRLHSRHPASSSPFFLAHMLNVFHSINPFVPWLLGIGGVVWILYQGIPRGLNSVPVHSFGIYLTTCMIVFMISGMVTALTALYLLGYIDFQNSWVLATNRPLAGTLNFEAR